MYCEPTEWKRIPGTDREWCTNGVGKYCERKVGGGDIGDYYDRCDRRSAEAHKRWRDAIRRGAPQEEIDRLEREMLRAGNTGD